MNNKRIYAFDVLRVISILGILCCHSCLEWPDYVWLGRYFAQTFNLVFLLLSAFLMGLKWEKEGYHRLPITFVKKRILRLMTTFYPFLVITIPILFLIGYHLSAKTIVSQFLFLSWLSPLPCFGQLWYLTMIVICYIICFLISRATSVRKLLSGGYGKFYLCVLLTFTAVLIALCTIYIFPGAIILYAVLYAVIFINSSAILRYVYEHSLWNWLCDGLIINSIALYLYYNGLFEYRAFSYLVSTLTATTVFGITLSLFRNDRINPFINFIAGISFEMYLVHEFFLGPINVYNYFNHAIGYIVLVILTIISAFVLKKISKISMSIFIK